jgi:hypothetical protein
VLPELMQTGPKKKKKNMEYIRLGILIKYWLNIIRIPRRVYCILYIGYEFKNKCNAQFISSANIITYFCKIMGSHY